MLVRNAHWVLLVVLFFLVYIIYTASDESPNHSTNASFDAFPREKPGNWSVLSCTSVDFIYVLRLPTKRVQKKFIRNLFVVIQFLQTPNKPTGCYIQQQRVHLLVARWYCSNRQNGWKGAIARHNSDKTEELQLYIYKSRFIHLYSYSQERPITLIAPDITHFCMKQVFQVHRTIFEVLW